MIWRSRWVTRDGIVECREALAYPGDPHRVVLLRRVQRRRPQRRAITVALDPRGDYDPDADDRPAPPRRGVDRARRAACTCDVTGAGDARPRDRPRPASTCTSTLRPGDSTTSSSRLSDRPAARPAARPGRRVASDRGGLARRGPDVRRDAEPARHPPQLRRAARPHLGQRRHGRRRHDQPARTRRSRPQLRLPLRLDPRPVLRRARPRHRRRRRTAARRRGRLRRRAPARPRRSTRPRLHARPATPVPDQRHLDLPGYPGGYDIVGNWVNEQFQLDAFGEALLLFARRRTPRPPGQPITGGQSSAAADAIADRWTEPDAGIWETGRPGVDAQPAHRRRRAAGDRRGDARRRQRAGLARPRRPDRRRHRQHAPCIRTDTGSARPTTRAWTPRSCCPAYAEPLAPDDPRSARDLRGLPARPDPGRLRLPVPPRRPSPGRRRRLVPAVRLPRRPHPPSATATRWPPAAGTTPRARPPGRRSCSARSTTRSNTRCAATCRRPSSTPCTSRPRLASATSRRNPQRTKETTVHDIPNPNCSTPTASTATTASTSPPTTTGRSPAAGQSTRRFLRLRRPALGTARRPTRLPARQPPAGSAHPGRTHSRRLAHRPRRRARLANWIDAFAATTSVLCGSHGDSGFGLSGARQEAQLRRTAPALTRPVDRLEPTAPPPAADDAMTDSPAPGTVEAAPSNGDPATRFVKAAAVGVIAVLALRGLRTAPRHRADRPHD